MTLNEKLAKWIYQFVAGVRREDTLGVLAELEKSQWYSADRLLDSQWKKFKAIIRYAYDEIPFYGKRFRDAGIEPEDIKTRDDLGGIPILTKSDIRENYIEIHSAKIKLFDRMCTSGSTAEPLTLTRCRDSLAHHRANMFRFRRWYGVEIGDFEANLRGMNVPSKDLAKLRLKDFLLNRWRLHGYDISSERLDTYYSQIRNSKLVTIYGFTSLIDRFTDHLITSGIGPKPFPWLKCVIPTGEMADDDQRDRWKSYYGVPVVDEYGCTEAGILAMVCPEGSWHVPIESCLVEYLPLGQGNGEGTTLTICVTDLMNKSIPIIRYDIGDSALPGNGKCACGRGLPMMKSFLGRKARLIDLPDGRTIQSFDFNSIIKQTGKIQPDAIKKFQVVITPPKGFQIYIVPGSQFNGDVMNFLEHDIGVALGEGAEIEFKLVDKIEPTKQGKYEHVIFVDE